MMCADEKDIEELNERYGPLRWQAYDKDPEGFKKLMWYGIMKFKPYLHVPSAEGQNWETYPESGGSYCKANGCGDK